MYLFAYVHVYNTKVLLSNITVGLVKCYCTFGNEDEALSISRALSKHLKNKAQSYYVSKLLFMHSCLVGTILNNDIISFI